MGTAEQSHPAGSASPSKPMAYGDVDGFGRFGVLDETVDGLACHQCAWRGTHLGLHAAKVHGSAAEYRVRHGLRRSKGLVAEATRATIKANATARYADNGPLAGSRDLTKANAARLAAALPASAEEAERRDARLSNMPRPSHARRVVTCEQCGVQFCPILANISKRRFCGMPCSNRHNRAQRTTK